MSKPNTITKKEYPDIWDSLIDEMTDESWESKEHRRGSSFYITPTYEHSADKSWEEVPEELYGYWEADPCTWSDDWGLDDQPTVLYRVEPVITERVIKETHYKRVIDES